jgi:hypothetical protein
MVNVLGGVPKHEGSQYVGLGLRVRVIPGVVGWPSAKAALATTLTHPTPLHVNPLNALTLTVMATVDPPTTTWTGVVVVEENVQNGVVAAAEVAYVAVKAEAIGTAVEPPLVRVMQVGGMLVATPQPVWKPIVEDLPDVTLPTMS